MYHKYHCVKCLVVGRRILGRNIARGVGILFFVMSIVKVKHTISLRDNFHLRTNSPLRDVWIKSYNSKCLLVNY